MAILQSGYTDASRTNASARSSRVYRDIALSFEKILIGETNPSSSYCLSWFDER